MLPVSSNKKHFLLSICYVCDMSFLFYVAIPKSVSFALIYWFLIPYYVVLAVLSFIWCYCKISFLILLFSTYLGCPHCKRIKPEFSEVAKEVNTENKVIKYSFMSTRVAHLPPNLAPMKRMKTSSTCVSEKSFCFTRSLLSVGNKHKFCSNFPCFKSESHFYPWKQSQILGKIKNKKKYGWSLYLYNWVNLGCFFFVYFLFIYLFFFWGGGCFDANSHFPRFCFSGPWCPGCSGLYCGWWSLYWTGSQALSHTWVFYFPSYSSNTCLWNGAKCYLLFSRTHQLTYIRSQA